MSISPKLWRDDLRLVVTTTARALRDDPLTFLLNVARRLRLGTAPSSGRAGVLNAYRWFLADRPDVAVELASQVQAGGVRGRLRRRLLVQLGAESATDDDPERIRWLARTAVGDLAGALGTTRTSSPAHRHTASELRLLAPSAAPPHQRGGTGGALFVLTNSLPYTHSGYTSRTQSLLSAIKHRGIDVNAATRIGYPTTVGLIGKPATATVGEITYHRLATGHLPLELDERAQLHVDLLSKLVDELRPGVLHTTTDYTNAVVTQELARRRSLPWVYEMRGQLEQTWVMNRPAPLREEAAASERVRLLRAKETELATQANAVIVLSEVQRSDLIARGVPAASIHVVPNSVDARLLEMDEIPTTARSALGLPTDGLWVGTVSSLVAYEGLDLLLRSVAECRAAGFDIRCAIVGDGASRPALEALAEDLGISSHVVFPGRQPREDSLRWFQALDVFTVPRLDGLVTRIVTPLKLVEASALQRPVVASDLPALNELVVTPQSGLSFLNGSVDSLAAQITRLAEDPQLRATLAQQGRAFARERTWQNAAAKIAGIYEEECGVKVH